MPFLKGSWKKCCTMKGTVSVLLEDPQCKEGNARFTMVPLKASSVYFNCLALICGNLPMRNSGENWSNKVFKGTIVNRAWRVTSNPTYSPFKYKMKRFCVGRTRRRPFWIKLSWLIDLLDVKGEDGKTTVRSSRLILDSEGSSNENIKYQVGGKPFLQIH